MLGKLLKYDLLATARVMLPMYLAIILLSLFSGGLVYGYYNNPFFTLQAAEPDWLVAAVTVAALLLLVLFAIMMLLTVVCIIKGFSANLLGDEGFLMFTLPVKATTLLWSKLLNGLFWLLSAAALGALSLWIVLVLPAVFSIHIGAAKVLALLGEVARIFLGVPDLTLWLLQIVAGVVLFAAAIMLAAYMALMIAQLPRFRNCHLLVAVAAFVLINWLFGFLCTVVPIAPFVLGGVGLGEVQAAAGLLVLVYLFQSAALFWGVKWLMTHRLAL